MPSQHTEQSAGPPLPRGLPAPVLFTAWLCLVVPAIPMLTVYPAGGILLLALALLALEGAVIAWFRREQGEPEANEEATGAADARVSHWREAELSRRRHALR